MKKHFNDFTEEEQKKILQINYEYIKKTELDWNHFYENSSSFVSEKEAELGLHFDFSITKNGDIKIRNDSFCTVNLLNTIEKLLEKNTENPDIIKLLEKAKFYCFLINEITGNFNYARIKYKNKQTVINFSTSRQSSVVITGEYIIFLLKEIKSYTQNPEIVKFIRKLEFEKLYNGKNDFLLINKLFELVLEEIKEDLQPLNDFIKDTMENGINDVQHMFDSVTTMGKITEILVNRIDILFDENDYNLFYV